MMVTGILEFQISSEFGRMVLQLKNSQRNKRLLKF